MGRFSADEIRPRRKRNSMSREGRVETAITGQLLLYAKGVELAIAGRLANSLARKPYIFLAHLQTETRSEKTREKVANNVRELVSRSAIWGETVTLFTFFTERTKNIVLSAPRKH